MAYFVFSIIFVFSLIFPSKASSATISYDHWDAEEALYKYQVFKSHTNEEGLHSALETYPYFKKDSLESLTKKLSPYLPLPELQVEGNKIKVLNTIPPEIIDLTNLSQGKISIDNKDYLLSPFKNFEDALLFFEQTKVSSLWFLNNYTPTHWLVPEVYAKSSKVKKSLIVGALFAFFIGLRNKVKEKNAEKALEQALNNNLPLGPETIYADTSAPHYSTRGLNPLQRLRAATGSNVDDNNSDGAVYSPDGTLENTLNSFLNRAPAHCKNEFIKTVLQTIPKIHQQVQALGKTGDSRRNGGYSLGGGGFNVPITMGPHTVHPGTASSSHCATATYTAFTKSLDSYARQKGCQIPASAVSHFQPKGSANQGVYKIWDNDNRGPADVAHYLNSVTGSATNFSKSHDPAFGCPGDFVKFDRNNKTGHNVVFLGFQSGKNGEQSFCYWSSNGSTQGYGIKCEPTKRIQAYNFLKVNNPLSVCEIKTPYNKNDTKVNGGSVYRLRYSGPEYASTLKLAENFHSSLQTTAEKPRSTTH